MSTVTSRIDVRSYRDDDEAEILRLLSASLGGGPAGRRPAEFFRWKHIENPFGRSLMLVAEMEGRIVGLRAFMRWRFTAGGHEIRAVRAVDTATHPDHQGRGIFRTLTLGALDELRAEGTHLVFNTPNDKSMPGYLKMGWETVGVVPVRIRVRRPLRFARALMAGLADDGAPERGALPVAAAEPAADVRLSYGDGTALETSRDAEYLRWRYMQAPLLGYRSVQVDGAVAYVRERWRGRLREATLADVFARPEPSGAIARVLREVRRTSRVDHLACSFPPGSRAARALVPAGFLPTGRGLTLVTNVLDPATGPDPRELPSWALSLGDLEVF